MKLKFCFLCHHEFGCHGKHVSSRRDMARTAFRNRSILSLYGSFAFAGVKLNFAKVRTREFWWQDGAFGGTQTYFAVPGTFVALCRFCRRISRALVLSDKHRTNSILRKLPACLSMDVFLGWYILGRHAVGGSCQGPCTRTRQSCTNCDTRRGQWSGVAIVGCQNLRIGESEFWTLGAFSQHMSAPPTFFSKVCTIGAAHMP